ncbi:helix-turn-helix domain-containing protein [Actinophytocola xanthii]|uniref:helix-turn-helix domain-containing protein n=1 Tax=Actinophytocola xanthii TaxID=1912961 RepID=UPI000B1AE70D|nr:helix-turn-helix transcriptional regulator [Actinophytocola xanthii]
MNGVEAFGIELRRRRIAADFSLARFAGQVHYSKGHLSKVENGLARPTEDFARRCDACLGAGGELLALVRPRGARRAEAAESSAASAFGAGEDDAEVWLMGLGPDGESGFQPVGRRDVLVMGMAAATALSIPGRVRPAHGGDVVGLSRSAFDHTRRLGQTVSASLVFPVVVSQAQMLRVLARSSPHARTELTLLAARNAEYAGWMAQESGDDNAALWWTRKAVRMAAGVGRHDLAAYALVREALVTLYQGDAAATIDLARQAQRDPQLPPRILGLAAQREAQGHALAGAYDECMHALDRAADLLALAAAQPRDGEPVIGTTTVSDPVAIVTGWCLHDLGHSRRAAEVLDREVAKIAPDAIRARVRFGLRQALAHAASGEIDHACALVEELLESVAALDSATALADVQRLSATMRRWPGHPAVRRLTPELTAAMSGSQRG